MQLRTMRIPAQRSKRTLKRAGLSVYWRDKGQRQRTVYMSEWRG